MKGAVAMTVPLPTLRSLWVSLFSDESILRPRYDGTGSVYLDSTLGGYHIFRIDPAESVDPRHEMLLGQRRRGAT